MAEAVTAYAASSPTRKLSNVPNLFFCKVYRYRPKYRYQFFFRRSFQRNRSPLVSKTISNTPALRGLLLYGRDGYEQNSILLC